MQARHCFLYNRGQGENFMKILFTSFYLFDLENKQVQKKEITDDFRLFIEEYIEYAHMNEKNKSYMIRNTNTSVVSMIQTILLNQEQWENQTKEIAKKLLEAEEMAQAKIYRMGQNIKKGSLIQALIEKGDSEYEYVIAKIEHSTWIDGQDLSVNYGFSKDKKSLWKSALFPIYKMDTQLVFETIQVYSDTMAKYWTVSFLELDEERNDSKNTYAAFKAMDAELKSAIEPISKHDYVQLSSELQNMMNTPQELDYDTCVDQILENYHPSEDEVEKEVMKDCLLALPERKKFDKQFKVVPESLNNRKTKKFKLSKGIELTVRSDAVEYPEKIVSTLVDGRRVLQIICEDEDTYETFH